MSVPNSTTSDTIWTKSKIMFTQSVFIYNYLFDICLSVSSQESQVNRYVENSAFCSYRIYYLFFTSDHIRKVSKRILAGKCLEIPVLRSPKLICKSGISRVPTLF